MTSHLYVQCSILNASVRMRHSICVSWTQAYRVASVIHSIRKFEPHYVQHIYIMYIILVYIRLFDIVPADGGEMCATISH